jgi:hypothetical protein
MDRREAACMLFSAEKTVFAEHDVEEGRRRKTAS